MLNFIRKFFVSPTELPEIAKLREVIAENRETSKRLLPWLVDPHNDAELMELQTQFANNIEDIELGQRVIARSAMLVSEGHARGWLHGVAWPVVARKNAERLRPVLKSAISALIASLETELDQAREHERELAAKYGLGHNDGQIAKSIDGSIGQAKARLAELDKIAAGANEYSQLGSLASQVLAQS